MISPPFCPQLYLLLRLPTGRPGQYGSSFPIQEVRCVSVQLHVTRQHLKFGVAPLTPCVKFLILPVPPNLVQTSGEAIVHPPGPVTRFLSALHLQGISQVGGCRSDANLRS